ncbi:ribonuclease PH/Ham1 protein [Peptoniphilus sp. ING2-D1G]|nr:ribonuclease PH/Ham1 protein [Peptoniphilus sp. ING2-D1G]
MRINRQNDEIREIKMNLNYTSNPEGSVLVEFGNTKVICTAMIEDKVPYFLKGKGIGWLSCEYSMLPGATKTRKVRDISKGKIDGRSQEIQRLIGRSLRACVDLSKLEEKTIWIDCDVISADGGTRTASINGAYAALVLAVNKAIEDKLIDENPIMCKIGAISLGMLKGIKLLDLDYQEDFSADVDLNLVMNDKFEIIEIQGTSEKTPMKKSDLYELLALGENGIRTIFDLYEKVLPLRKKIVLSSDNINKINEIKELLIDIPVDVVSKKQAGFGGMEIDEKFNTLEENAKTKAVSIKKEINMPVIADDSGLFVDYLGGEPGVHSARYSLSHDDRANRKKLLENLENVDNRKAHFKTILVYIDEEDQEHYFEGICEGEIAEEEKGENGFGYDNIFVPKGYNKTFGEMTDEEKNRMSHRSKALEKFRKFIIKYIK